jgi:hypothetical protein
MAEGSSIFILTFDIFGVATLSRHILRSDGAVIAESLGAQNIRFMEYCVNNYTAMAMPLGNTPREEGQAASP